MSDSIRIPANQGTQYINFKIEQDFDFIKILSLNISQENAYRNFCSDYGVVVGRVLVNNGFGIPNAKVSVFIPVDDVDKANPQIYGLYPFETVTDTNSNGIRYNLLKSEPDNQNPCYTPVGTFPSKREVLDNDEMLYVYCKYYKFTTTTNYAGDFMLFGIPLGTYTLHVDADISDIGIASQKPYDLISQGTPKEFFYSSTKFKGGTNLDSLVQIKSANVSVNVLPFWGDTDNCQIGINRVEINLNYSLTPSAIFIGSLFGDSKKNSVNKNCIPRKKLGVLCEQETGQGTIEMIRKTLNNQIESFNVNGGRVIDDNGNWAYQIPMNLDYVVTSETGELIPSKDTTKGIPTRSRVRFRISMDEESDIGRIRTHGKYLVPHNPNTISDIDFNFDSTTNDNSFTDLYWNKIYTIKNFIPRTETNVGNIINKAELIASGGVGQTNTNFTGIKDVDGCVGNKNPFPYNRFYSQKNILFTVICLIITIISAIVSVINSIVCVSILGVHPFGWINPIKLNCNGQDYTPGCGQTAKNFDTCIATILAQDLDIFQFDFYNDWVNGSLYYYLLKYKKKASGSERFCETYCKEISPLDGISGTSYNECHTIQLHDSTNSNVSNTSTSDSFYDSMLNGLLVQYNKILYYPPLTLNNNNNKLFATDIVNLGSILSCDWQGYPQIIQYLTNSSFKMPPLIQEPVDMSNGIPIGETVTGIFDISGQYTGLFFTIDCAGIGANEQKCLNIRRLSEIGVDLPSATGTSTPPYAVSINQIYEQTNTIDTQTSINKYLRDSLYLLNINGSQETYPSNNLTQLNSIANGTSFGITGQDYVGTPDFNDGNAYKLYRNFSNNSNIGLDFSSQAKGNSYYFYFGIVPNNTALDLFRKNFFTTCINQVKDEFDIIVSVTNATTTTSTDGSISFTFLGGTPPYRYTITNINYNSGLLTTNTSGSITGLPASTQPYIITATDALNTVMIREVSLFGPQPFTCSFSILNPPTTTTSNNGSINIQYLLGGIHPYSINISGPNTNINLTNASLSDSPINNIGVGTYVITASDSSNPVNKCITTLNVTTVAPILITQPILPKYAPCSTTDCSTSINPIISGGYPPYNVNLVGTMGYNQTYSYNNMQFNDLCSDTYTLTATDSNGQKTTATVVVSQPATLTLSGVRDSNNVITYTATGGQPPYIYSPVDTNSTNTYTAPSSDLITATVTDSVACTATAQL
jgi:hypothetical protein